MRTAHVSMRIVALAFALTALLFLPSRSYAHCDGMDGPVVKAAQKAIETGNVKLALIWANSAAENEIRRAFNQTLTVRKLSPESRDLADRFFFETLVRLHRAGEGEPYTGLKPAGRDLGPAIPAADGALVSGSPDKLIELLTRAARDAVRKRFEAAISRKTYDADNLQAGRKYVAAYIEFVHTVEGLYEAAQNPKAGHADEPGAAEQHAEAR